VVKTIRLFTKVIGSNFSDRRLPYKLTWAMTDRCNHRCKVCNIWKGPKADDSSLEEIESFFEKAPFFSWISLTGGEIFLRDDIYEICRIISGRVRDICFLTFPTNGFLTDKIVGDIEKIIGLNFNKVVASISLDGPPLLHDELRGIPGAWEKAVRTFILLKKIKSKKFSVNFGYTISNYNLLSISDTVRALREVYPGFSLKDFHINLAFNAGRYLNLNDRNIAINDREALIKQLGAYQKRKPLNDLLSVIDYTHVRLLKRFIRSGRTPLPCLSLASSCFIDSGWNLYPCFNFDSRIGNLKEAGFDFKKLWDDPERIKVRDMIKAGGCPQCWTPCESYQTILGNLARVL